MFGVFMLDLSFKETWAFEGELKNVHISSGKR